MLRLPDSSESGAFRTDPALILIFLDCVISEGNGCQRFEIGHDQVRFSFDLTGSAITPAKDQRLGRIRCGVK